MRHAACRSEKSREEAALNFDKSNSSGSNREEQGGEGRSASTSMVDDRERIEESKQMVEAMENSMSDGSTCCISLLALKHSYLGYLGENTNERW